MWSSMILWLSLTSKSATIHYYYSALSEAQSGSRLIFRGHYNTIKWPFHRWYFEYPCFGKCHDSSLLFCTPSNLLILLFIMIYLISLNRCWHFAPLRFWWLNLLLKWKYSKIRSLHIFRLFPKARPWAKSF